MHRILWKKNLKTAPGIILKTHYELAIFLLSIKLFHTYAVNKMKTTKLHVKIKSCIQIYRGKKTDKQAGILTYRRIYTDNRREEKIMLIEEFSYTLCDNVEEGETSNFA